MGTSVQDNIGLGRIGFNAGLNYFANVNDVVSHRLSLFNTQLSFTQNKDKYYDFFPGDERVRNEMFDIYSPTLLDEVESGQISSDDASSMIMSDEAFRNSLSGENLSKFNSFVQSLINKDRQTQDVLISSMIYNFVYNEIGKKDRPNPFYFNGKVELAGNIFSLFNARQTKDGVISGETRSIFNIPYSQFVKQ